MAVFNVTFFKEYEACIQIEAESAEEAGEVRTYEYNTRKMIIHKMSVKLRDTLNWNGK